MLQSHHMHLANLQSFVVLFFFALTLIYTSYFLNNIASLGARLRGWPHEKAPFSLGRWGTLINVLALIYGGLMIINFLWFGGLRSIYTNTALGVAFSGLANVPFINDIPLFELTLAILFVVGAIYWYGFKRRSVVAGDQKPAEALAD